MQLSSSEKGWLPWFGKTGKFSMGWACRLNRASYPQVEQTFEAIAQTRVQLLHEWVREQWEHLADLAEQVTPGLAQVDSAMLRNTLAQAEDFSELFVVDAHGIVIASTATAWHATHRALGSPGARAESTVSARALQRPADLAGRPVFLALPR